MGLWLAAARPLAVAANVAASLEKSRRFILLASLGRGQGVDPADQRWRATRLQRRVQVQVVPSRGWLFSTHSHGEKDTLGDRPSLRFKAISLPWAMEAALTPAAWQAAGWVLPVSVAFPWGAWA